MVCNVNDHHPITLSTFKIVMNNKLLQISINMLGGSDRFRRNFMKIASANALAQVISIVSLPLLSRLYLPEYFGVLTTYTLMQSVVLSFVTGRIEWIIPNAKSHLQVRRLLGLGVIITLGVLCFVMGALIAFHNQIETVFDLQQIGPFLWLLPIGVIAGALQLLWQSWYVFGGDLTKVGYSKLAQSVVTMLLSLVLGLTTLAGMGLVSAYVVGFMAAVIVLFSGRNKDVGSVMGFKPKRIVRLLRLYGRQMMASTTLSIINISMNMSLTMLLILFYSSQIVGWYGLVFRVATAPIGLFTTAIVQSFWTDAALLAKKDPRALRTFYLGSIKRLCIVSIPFAVVFLCGPLYIPFIFGRENWSGAGHLLMAVTPYLIGMIIFSPTTHLIVYGKAHWQMVCDFFTFLASVAGFALVANAGHDAWIAVAVASSILLVGYLIRFFVHLRANTQLIEKFSSGSSSASDEVRLKGGK